MKKVPNYDIENPTKQSAPRGPEKKFRAGAIAATVWRNETQRDGQTVSFNSISLERRYKDKDGQWKTANSLRINDLPRAALLLHEAYRYCVMSDTEAKADASVVL